MDPMQCQHFTAYERLNKGQQSNVCRLKRQWHQCRQQKMLALGPQSQRSTYFECVSDSTFPFFCNQMISRIEYVHTKNFIHRDIKPDNFLMGIGRHCNKVGRHNLLCNSKTLIFPVNTLLLDTFGPQLPDNSIYKSAGSLFTLVSVDQQLNRLELLLMHTFDRSIVHFSTVKIHTF